MKQQEIPNTKEQNKAATSVVEREGQATAAVSIQTNKWAVMAILAIGIFMATLDSSIVNISLPTIARYFGVPLNGAIEWVIIAYLLVIAGVLLTTGRLADMIGRKPIWVAGLIIFTGGSAICGASVALWMLIAARALQGLGGALIMAVSPAMLTGAFPASERGRALGLNAVIVALGVSVGPTLGGIITENFTWRWIFYVNVPIGIIGIVLSLRVLKEQVRSGKSRFDPAGAILLAIGLIALTMGLSFGQEWGWNSPLLIGTLVVSVVALVALYVVEHRVSDPVIDFSMLRDRVFLSANVSLVLNFLALFAVSFMLPFYLEELRGFTTEQSGLLLTPLPLTIAVIAPFSGALADRIGSRWLAASGLLIACIGLVFISQLNAQSSVFDIVWRLVLTGAGQAMFQSPNNSALMGAAPRGRQGVASGFLATGRVVGQSISVALAGAIFASLGGATAGRILVSAQHKLPPGQMAALQQTFTSSFHAAFLVCAGIAAIGVITSLVRGKER
ncbi:MAG TPA: MFS transporter [Ktedonobacteraceae bacterium]|jgi:EmrB/QacA subfamily drug resistance transporter|nr:MFS transporter [Ktedonobacteraceae bacterium]